MHVTFRAGSLDLAVPAAAVTEIVPATGVRHLPGMEPAVAGVMLGSGGVIGIVDLDRFAGTASTGARVVMVLAGEPRLGLLVQAPDAVSRAVDQASPALEGAALPLLGAVRCADKSFHRVDLDELRRRLRALPAARRRRGGEHGDPDPGGR